MTGCCSSAPLHQRRPPQDVAIGVVGGPKLEEVFARCQGRIVVTSFTSNIHRVQQVVDAAAQLGRKVSLVGRSMRKNVNIGRQLGHIDVPDRLLVGPREIEDYRPRSWSSPRGARASPCRPCAAWPTSTTPTSRCTKGTR